ncbi:MAG: methyltransferase domain-containing protein, partial [Ignavibacteria bacterium]|nr:methyltransferase domain-containing protein [Ignavibacteria bacterium]
QILNDFPAKHYVLFAGFVKTLDPAVVTVFTDRLDELTLVSLKKYFRENGKIIVFLENGGIVCSNYPGLIDQRIKIINTDLSSEAINKNYSEIIGLTDMIFCDIENLELNEKVLSVLNNLNYSRNPLLIANNTEMSEAEQSILNLGKPYMPLASFSTEKGTAVAEIKKQLAAPSELPPEKLSSKLHIGCGYQKLNGFINVDVRPTEATDLVHSCIEFDDFPTGKFDLIYSHAFFEHLNANDELRCLKNIKNLLSLNGKVMFLGIPDFEIIAKAYREKLKGPLSETFNLMQVYRYTHGAPEQGGEDWWFEQFHKSVFDVDRILTLLTFAGYSHFIIFRYYFRDETLPLSLGFLAADNLRFDNYNSELVFDEIGKICKDVTNRNVEILFIK